jgi:hypothetical protein
MRFSVIFTILSVVAAAAAIPLVSETKAIPALNDSALSSDLKSRMRS